jgi:Family of unknown function (DUF5681)
LEAQTLGVGPRVQNNVKNNAKKPGGITGKGFSPGQSGNPGGRPKKRPISERYLTVAELPVDEKLRKKLGLPIGATYADAGVVAQYNAMIRGNPSAAREIREAIEGKATHRLELTGESGGPVATKLDLKSTLAAIREFYGIAPVEDSGEHPADFKPADAVPVPTALAERSEPKKTSEEK